jgi:hypothetical protein
MREQQDILDSCPYALHGHRVLGLSPWPIRIAIHVPHGKGDHEHDRCALDPGSGTHDVGLDGFRTISVPCAINPQAFPHCCRKASLWVFTSEDGEAPWLPIVR